jgi:prophage regulatory protein
MRLIPISELNAQKGINYSRPHIYRLMSANKFPKPIHVGGNRIAFIESEIDVWIKSKIQERDAVRGAA